MHCMSTYYIIIVTFCQARTTATVTWRGNTASVTTASVNMDMENTGNTGAVAEPPPTTNS